MPAAGKTLGIVRCGYPRRSTEIGETAVPGDAMGDAQPLDHERGRAEYRVIWDLLEHARVVPFLGAGASLANSDSIDPAQNLPAGRELANRLAAKLGLAQDEIDADDLLEVASCFALLTRRGDLENALKDVFGRKSRPGSLHRFIAGLRVPPPLIITTNYDTLIEQSFREVGRTFHVIMTPIHDRSFVLWWGPDGACAHITPDKLITPEDVPTIYKIHGGVSPTGEWISSVITEDDYFEIGGRLYDSKLLPFQVGELLHNSSLLFLGYSLRDIHIRFMIGRSLSWSQQLHFVVNKCVSRMDRLRFQELNVKLIESPIAAFLERLLVAKSDADAGGQRKSLVSGAVVARNP